MTASNAAPAELATATTAKAPTVRTLAAIDIDIAAVDIRLVGAKALGQSIRELRLERGRLGIERNELLMRQQGVSPEDLGIISLANHDRRQGRFDVAS
jgi:hypothetical protein